MLLFFLDYLGEEDKLNISFLLFILANQVTNYRIFLVILQLCSLKQRTHNCFKQQTGALWHVWHTVLHMSHNSLVHADWTGSGSKTLRAAKNDLRLRPFQAANAASVFRCRYLSVGHTGNPMELQALAAASYKQRSAAST